MQARQMRRTISRIIIVSVSVTILALVIGASGDYALGRFRFRGRSLVLYSVLAMTMFPSRHRAW